jgi:hypothetical protein
MLKQLTYASRTNRPMNIMDMNNILKTSRTNNAAFGVTGALFLHDDMFVQQLEGETATIDALYERIVQDERHREVTIIDTADIPRRRFESWSMGMFTEDAENRYVFQKHSSTGKFDPFTMGVANLRAFFGEILDHTRWIT